jgi:intracellular sulfur oxidation DsrE/DsrF family protein
MAGLSAAQSDPTRTPESFAMPTTRRQVLLAATGALLLPTAQAQQAGPHKAVFQVSDNDPAKWNLALNNVRNVQDDLGAESTELAIVVYGPGIGMLKGDSPVAARVAAALKAGVKVLACENTMRNQKLVYADMLPAIGYVQAGVTDLMKKQREGWAYIRP